MADVASPTARAVNKVEINGKTVIDLTQDTVTPKTLKKGVTAHSASGKRITGTAEEDLSLGMTSAAVGDFIRVKSVDENGKPTSWEPVQAEEAETVDVDLLPAVTAEDNDKVLQVVEGAWQAKDLSMGGGNEEAWEKIGEIDFTADVAADVHAWTFDNLSGYKTLLFKRVRMTGSTANISYLTSKINGISTGTGQIPYQKSGSTGSGLSFFIAMPEGILNVSTGMANSPTNYAQGSMATSYNLLPCIVSQITKIELADNRLYPIASGELIIYGLRGSITTQEGA